MANCTTPATVNWPPASGYSASTSEGSAAAADDGLGPADGVGPGTGAIAEASTTPVPEPLPVAEASTTPVPEPLPVAEASATPVPGLLAAGVRSGPADGTAAVVWAGRAGTAGWARAALPPSGPAVMQDARPSGQQAASRQRREKGGSPLLCAAPFGPFRQMGTVPFFPAGQQNPSGVREALRACCGTHRQQSKVKGS